VTKARAPTKMSRCKSLGHTIRKCPVSVAAAENTFGIQSGSSSGGIQLGFKNTRKRQQKYKSYITVVASQSLAMRIM
jgi:hypothetical protein